MKAALISLGSVSSTWVAEEMKKYFDLVDIINLKEIEVTLGKHGDVFYQGKELGQYDCVYLKGSFRYANLLRSVATFLERKTAYMPLTADSFTIVHNKLLTHLALQQQHIPMPQTFLSPNVDAAKKLLKEVRYPIVMKFPEGTQGKGVMFADSFASASSLLDALGALKQLFIIQEYIETDGTDIRALVVGEKVVAAMKRKAQTEEKRANIHAGGVGEAVQLNSDTMAVAVETAQVLGADVCGIDILEGPHGPLVIEANISPGLQGLSKVVTTNIPDEIAKYFHRRTSAILSERHEKSASKVMKEISPGFSPAQEIVARIQLRGDRIILPEFVNKIAKFSERKEYSIKVRKGKVEAQEL